jgi:Zn-finger nucleic acid-binding protein
VNGCGNLTHDTHDKLTVNRRIALVVGGIISILLWVQSLPFSDSKFAFYWFVSSILLIVGGIFPHNRFRDVPYYICKVCKGGMLDSKSLIEKFGKYNAGLIEYSLKKADFGEKKCPICEEKMKIIPLEYSTINFYEGPILMPIPSGNKKIELDGCHDCSMIWFDSAEMDYVASSTKLKRDRMTEKTSRSSNKSIFECSELDCKNESMQKSKYCQKHQDLSKKFCLGLDSRGKRCKRPPKKEEDYCYYHLHNQN